MNAIRPYPDIAPPAFTVLVRAAEGDTITAEVAARIVGPDLAAEAIAQLEAKHLLAAGEWLPVGLAVRRWNRPKSTHQKEA